MKKIMKTGKTVYKHLQPFERDEISHLLSQNYTQKEIAERLKKVLRQSAEKYIVMGLKFARPVTDQIGLS